MKEELIMVVIVDEVQLPAGERNHSRMGMDVERGCRQKRGGIKPIEDSYILSSTPASYSHIQVQPCKHNFYVEKMENN